MLKCINLFHFLFCFIFTFHFSLPRLSHDEPVYLFILFSKRNFNLSSFSSQSSVPEGLKTMALLAFLFLSKMWSKEAYLIWNCNNLYFIRKWRVNWQSGVYEHHLEWRFEWCIRWAFFSQKLISFKKLHFFNYKSNLLQNEDVFIFLRFKWEWSH